MGGEDFCFVCFMNFQHNDGLLNRLLLKNGVRFSLKNLPVSLFHRPLQPQKWSTIPLNPLMWPQVESTWQQRPTGMNESPLIGYICCSTSPLLLVWSRFRFTFVSLCRFSFSFSSHFDNFFFLLHHLGTIHCHFVPHFGYFSCFCVSHFGPNHVNVLQLNRRFFCRWPDSAFKICFFFPRFCQTFSLPGPPLVMSMLRLPSCKSPFQLLTIILFWCHFKGKKGRGVKFPHQGVFGVQSVYFGVLDIE